ncbi:hypothetical protein GCM10011312_00700 [Planktosalinus lacus]|uniref:Outer membrane protein beta-barrel domain-containing protein n=1 Tax=Planktosalinus lacus TaxID=1526573 RepID=A0A8J2V639_9FLAO|nr:hypothetical protein GCM10011312_00700 [Planktosalinus lacus]
MFLKTLILKINYFFLILFTFILSFQAYSQRNYNEFNVIGVSAGLTLYDIKTDDLSTQSKESFMFGLQIRGNVYNNFDMMYGVAFYDTNISVLANSVPEGGTQRELNYNIQSAQISVLWGYKIIREHLSIEAGPVLNINGRLTLKDTQYENYIIDGYDTLRAIELEDISKVNFHLAAGVTAGFRNFRVFGQYQYGVTNMLSKLNSSNLEYKDFKGNANLITVGVTAYF